MFESLGDRLQNAINKIKGYGLVVKLGPTRQVNMRFRLEKAKNLIYVKINNFQNINNINY